MDPIRAVWAPVLAAAVLRIAEAAFFFLPWRRWRRLGGMDGRLFQADEDFGMAGHPSDVEAGTEERVKTSFSPQLRQPSSLISASPSEVVSSIPMMEAPCLAPILFRLLSHSGA